MKKIIYILLIIIILLSIPFILHSQEYKVITGGTVINTNGTGVIEDAVIIIKDNIIVEVGKNIKAQIPQNSEIIEAGGKFIIPGLIDSHIHFFQSGGLYTRPDAIDLRNRLSYPSELDWIRNNIDDVFKRYIRCGITSVVDLGGPFWNFAIRDYSKTADIAPRVFITGPLISSYEPEKLKTDDLAIIKVTTKDEALKLTKKIMDKQPDFMKIWYIVGRDGWSSENDFFPIVKAVADESHKKGLPLYVHATELETAKKAMQAGADVLVHMVRDKDIDDEFIALAKKNNVVIIPTLWVFKSYESVFTKQMKLLTSEYWLGNPKIISSFFDMYELSFDELGERQKKLLVDKRSIGIDSVWLRNLKKMKEAGITIAVGTDAGNIGVLHGPSIFHEFDYMTKAGLSNHELLVDATFNAAKMLRREKELGSIEKGKLADLVILNSNPLDDIQNTSDISVVIKNGKIFVPDSVLPKKPEDIAQVQLNAYNARDIGAFLSAYTDSVEVFLFPDTFRYKGKEEMRKVYSAFFDKAPSLHCKLLNRIVKGNYVIDREFITGVPGRENINAVAIYETEGGLIIKVWFLP
ncbi:MAG: amidohydrolase family protein [Ignavibacteriae bacterium]|nr:amidohydrolase family protein [Ignavibacteriota bacterium]